MSSTRSLRLTGRRFDVLVYSGALAFAVAVAAHTVVHAVGAGEGFRLVTSAHGIMLATAVVGLVLAAVRLGAGGPAADVRRRAALLGAEIAARPGSIAGATALQCAAIAALLALENASIAPAHAGEAIACGGLAALVSGIALRWLATRVPRAVAALCAPHVVVARDAAFRPPFARAFPVRRLAVARTRPVRAPPVR